RQPLSNRRRLRSPDAESAGLPAHLEAAVPLRELKSHVLPAKRAAGGTDMLGKRCFAGTSQRLTFCYGHVNSVFPDAGTRRRRGATADVRLSARGCPTARRSPA